VASKGPAGAAAPATQTTRHLDDTRPTDRGCTKPGVGGGFQFDATTDGRPIKIVSIIDEHARECLGGLVDRSITADVLIDELDRIATSRGYPAVLRCDNGSELACEAMGDGAGERVGLAFIPPGPWRNGYIESFNARVRDECLINIFWSLTHARVVIADWTAEYNYHRRHSALGYQTPASYGAASTHQ
jgi:putative transposase